jgi:predicted secreted Zn-dependent protease
VVEFGFEADLRVKWDTLLALIKAHADVLHAIGLAPTRDASRWCLPLRAIAHCPLDARHPISIIVST